MSLYRDITDPALTRRGRLSVLYYAIRRRFVPPAANTEQCPCGRPLDPTVFHDDDHQGRQLCVRCCPTCITTTTTKENTP